MRCRPVARQAQGMGWLSGTYLGVYKPMPSRLGCCRALEQRHLPEQSRNGGWRQGGAALARYAYPN